jgi:ribokinase
VDTTGAADAFIAALAAYLSSGYSMEASARIAAYAAGFCVSRQGVIPALIDRNSLETYINRIEPELLKL